MDAVHKRGLHIDRITVGGLTYLVSLDDGPPQILPLENYIRILKEKTALCQLVSTGHYLVEQALVGAQTPDEIIADVSAKLASLSEERASSTKGLRHVRDIIESFPGGFNTFPDYSRRPSGVMTSFHRLDNMTGAPCAAAIW